MKTVGSQCLRVGVVALGCGGVVARIEFGVDVVTWHDFRHANYLTPQGMGTFVFARSQYDRALDVARRATPSGS
jgi:hypothetical protein